MKPMCRVEDMTLDVYVPTTEKNRMNYMQLRQLLKNEDSWRFAFFDFTSDDGFRVFHGLRHYWRNRNDVLGVHANEFMDDIVQDICYGLGVFCEKYFAPKILLMDDGHFLMSSETSQRELYVLLKKRLEAKKLTILMSPYGLSEMRTYFRDDLIQMMALGLQEA